jgi:predicted alpha/beta-hydrolase family hydrolase
MPESFEIDVEQGQRVSATAYHAKVGAPIAATLVLGHGAGADQRSAFMVAFGAGLSSLGINVVTFNFLYMERGRSAPDPAPRLESAFRAAIDSVKNIPELASARLFIGGKSLGGRIASHLAASEKPIANLAGLICLGYPLHPPNRPEKPRTEHLERIRVPIFVAQGSRDAFGSPAEVEPVLEQLKTPTRLFVVEGGDHSFTVPKKWPKSQDQVYAEVQDEILRFVGHSSNL